MISWTDKWERTTLWPFTVSLDLGEFLKILNFEMSLVCTYYVSSSMFLLGICIFCAWRYATHVSWSCSLFIGLLLFFTNRRSYSRAWHLRRDDLNPFVYAIKLFSICTWCPSFSKRYSISLFKISRYIFTCFMSKPKIKYSLQVFCLHHLGDI